jgi:hypothetical protein
VLVIFCCCDKIPEKNNLKAERFILAHDFSPLLAVPIAFRPEAKRGRVSWGGRMWRGKVAPSWQTGRKDRGVRSKGRSQGQDKLFKLVISYQGGPLNSPLIYELVSGLMHCWRYTVLWFSQLSVAPPAGSQAFSTWALLRTFLFKPQQQWPCALLNKRIYLYNCFPPWVELWHHSSQVLVSTPHPQLPTKTIPSLTQSQPSLICS